MPSSHAQDTLMMPVTGNGGIYNTCYATIYDNGGRDSNYANYSNSTITIAPLWVQQVDLYFEIFDTETFFDSLSIYDGPGTAFPLIGTYSGNSLQGQTVSSTGSSITLAFRSDDIQTGAGFKAWVSCLMGEKPLTNENPLFIYPNPVKSGFTLAGFPPSEIANLSIVDMTGRSIYSPIIANIIDVSFLIPGMYGLIVTDKNSNSSFIRLIKQ